MYLLLRSGFCLSTLPYRPDWWSAAEMVVLLEGSPLSTEQCWSSVRVTISFLVTSLTKALLPWSRRVDGRPALRRVLVVPNFFYLQMMEATVHNGIFSATAIFLKPSPNRHNRRSTDNSLDFMCFSKSWPISWILDCNQVVETSEGWWVETGCTWAHFCKRKNHETKYLQWSCDGEGTTWWL